MRLVFYHFEREATIEEPAPELVALIETLSGRARPSGYAALATTSRRRPRSRRGTQISTSRL